jgi:hypothetical protein
VFAAPNGVWWVSTSHGGLMRYDAEKKTCMKVGTLIGSAANAKVPVPPQGDVEGAGLRHIVPPKPPREGGDSARKASSGPQPLMNIVTDLAFSSKDWYAATSSGLLVSGDQGATWRLTPVGPLASLPVQSVRVSPDGRRIRVVSLRGLVFSNDGGASWTWHDLPWESGGAVALNATPGDENTLIAMARNGLYISRDGGNSWQQAASGLPSTPVQDFAATGGVFVASMRTGGLYVSSDTGRTWERVPGPLADGFFAAVAPANEAGAVFAASTTEGLYRVDWPGAASNPATFSGQFGEPAAGEGANPRH